MGDIAITRCGDCPLVDAPSDGRTAWWCGIRKCGPWRGQELQVRAHPYEIPKNCPLRKGPITVSIASDSSIADAILETDARAAKETGLPKGKP